MKSEDEVTQEIRLEAGHRGIYLWRNNVGVMEDIENPGRYIRFGLANDSAQVNRRIKSSDLIGVMHPGTFIAVECKRQGWTYKGTDRETAQKRFIDLVRSNRGIAGFCSSVEDFEVLLDLGRTRHG